MIKTKTISGTSHQCVTTLEGWVRELGVEKPQLNYLSRLIEPLVEGFCMDENATYNTTLTMDVEAMSLTFAAQKVATA